MGGRGREKTSLSEIRIYQDGIGRPGPREGQQDFRSLLTLALEIRYHSAAEAELLNEISYLEYQATGLGKRLFDEVLLAEKCIQELPLSSPEVRAGIRKLVLRKFRYSLYYTVETQSVVILAVAHHRRAPFYWEDRA